MTQFPFPDSHLPFVRCCLVSVTSSWGSLFPDREGHIPGKPISWRREQG